jgi:hypothetical protein
MPARTNVAASTLLLTQTTTKVSVSQVWNLSTQTARPLLLLENLLQNFLGDLQHEPGSSGLGLRRKGLAKLQ